MSHPYIAAQAAADRRDRITADVSAFHTAAAIRRHAARPSRTTVQISLLRRRLKQLAPPRDGAAACPSYYDTARRAS
jgi:hypothetical protein